MTALAYLPSIFARMALLEYSSEMGANIPRPLPFPQRCTRKEGDAAVLSAAEKARDKYNIIYI